MNNFRNGPQAKEIFFQLDRANLKKNYLIENIYKEYAIYLQLIRDLLFLSFEKGIDKLNTELSEKNRSLKTRELEILIEKINNFITSKLPLITIEQLKISRISDHTTKKKDLDLREKEEQIMEISNDEYEFQDNFTSYESEEFHIDGNLSNNIEYYQPEKNESFVSLDLDSNEYQNNFPIFKNMEKLGLEKQLVSSLLELVQEDNVDNSKDLKSLNNSNMDNNKSYQLSNFEFMEESLISFLLNLSFDINQELYKSKVIKKIISRDSFKYLVNNKFMVRHPHPFVMSFDLNINQSIKNKEKPYSFSFLNLTTVELEFNNLNLSIQKNKIRELKREFKILIKKEKYWRQKERNLNKINMTM